MVNETDIAFALLRSTIDGTVPELEPMGASQWWQVFRLMQRHHVVAISYMAAARCQMPREVLMPWLSESEKATDWHRYQLTVQQDIVDIMQRNGIPCMVLKGTHTAQYYPESELREFGDLDLYFGDRHAEADEVARRELKVTVDETPHHHTRYSYRGVMVESHYEFFNRYYPGSNRHYNSMLASMEPSPTFDVLHFLRHAAIHFAAQSLNLRDLCDWVFLANGCNNVDWNRVETEVKRFGMSTFVATLDRITRSRLGTSSPLQGDCPDGLATQMENDIIYGGLPGGTIRQYIHNRWKRHLAFNDNEISLLTHKVISHLSHKIQ
jgi:hypothetical protein